ncbi:MAG: ion channel [Pseudomonadota bacterium]
MTDTATPQPAPRQGKTWLHGLKEHLRGLYHGKSAAGRTFRFTMLAIDIAAIVFFLVTSVMEGALWIYVIDGILAVFILSDLSIRYWISYHRKKFMLQLTTWADIVVVITLLLPMFLDNLLFLRVIRALRLLRSFRVLSDLRSEFAFFRRNEEIIQSTVNLLVFVFVMTALVFVLQADYNPKINNYIDALYFTVAALTTTGFGDITLIGTSGRLLSVLILLLGVALFLRLVQAIFRPQHVMHECEDCGLTRHDTDAVHCKHCGKTIHIKTDGEI